MGVKFDLAGRINDADIAGEIIELGDADLVALGRALLVEPDLPRKASTEDNQEIRKCISCNMCTDRLFKGLDVRCAVNASTGNEQAFKICRSGKRKKALVVGGGPGGMEAARVLALMGHEVTIWEKNARLGGKIALITRILPRKEELSHLIKWYELKLSRLPVNIVYNKQGTAYEIIEVGADFAVLAIGALPRVLDGVQIDDKARVMYADEVLEKGMEHRGKIGIIGGGWVGLEIAEFMLMKGASVTIVEKLPHLGAGMDVLGKKTMIDEIMQYPVEILLGTELEKISENGITVKDKNGSRVLELDYVIIAVGYQPNTEILSELREFEKSGGNLKYVAVGDCLGARKVGDAIFEGAFSAIEFCRGNNHAKNH